MANRSLEDIAKKMRDIDVAILSTRTEGGAIASRPMSNNRDVEWDGDNYFFACGDTRAVQDIEKDPQVGLSFHGKSGLIGQRPFFVGVEGRADLIRDKSEFEKHWNPDIELWFEDGIDTPDLVMIKVHAERLHYWDGADEGELKL